MDNITVLQSYLLHSGRDILLEQAMLKLTDSEIEDLVESCNKRNEADWPEYQVRSAVITDITVLLEKKRDAVHFQQYAV